MKLLSVILLGLTSIGAFAQGISCREAVVLGNSVLGEKVEENSFSVYAPEDFTMAPAQFNTLTIEEQEAIFLQYTPIETMVQKHKRKARVEY